MDWFSEIFMPLEFPNPDFNPCENVLNQIRNMDDALEAERRQACTRHFMNQLNEAEAGNISAVGGDQGAVGGQGPPPPPKQLMDPANVQIVNEYNSFNLANVTPPVAPKWKQTDTLLDDFHKFKCSCKRIFDGLMCHITSGKVKTSMLLTWAGPDGEDIYESFNLPPHQVNDIDLVLQKFEEFCEPIYNFRTARFKFTKVSQHQGEAIDTFYNRILKLAHQCNFSNPDEWLIDAIIFGTSCVTAQDKLLQASKTLSLQQCLTVCHHYEGLKSHMLQIRPDKHVEFLRKQHPTKKKQGSKPLN